MKKLKKHVSMPGLLERVRSVFNQIPDRVKRGSAIRLSDCLMSGLAVFSLKSPSLLQFEEARHDEVLRKNLLHLYGLEQVPCDTYMREQLDNVDPVSLYAAFKRVQCAAQRQKLWERYDYLDGYKLISIDGTGCFSSSQVHCENCCVKKHRDGRRTYYHQLLGIVMVHPDEKVVLPFAPEAILKQDGSKKNDCERNASERALIRLHKEHPLLNAIEDERLSFRA